MSMFSGFSNQITGFVAQKMGKGEAPPEDPNAAAAAAGEVPLQENGEEVPVEGQAGAGGAMGGAMGFAQGLMMKAAAAKDGIKEKAGGLSGLQAPFGGGAAPAEGVEGEQQYTEQGELIEGQEGMEGQQPAGAMGFAAGLMMKAHSLKEGVKEKSSGMNLGNVQAMGSMAGGMMSQVQGIIPGMRREEEVPDPAPPQEEYQEYQEEQYTE